jgi:hypothetical protein
MGHDQMEGVARLLPTERQERRQIVFKTRFFPIARVTSWYHRKAFTKITKEELARDNVVARCRTLLSTINANPSFVFLAHLQL